RGVDANGWNVDVFANGISILDHDVICEFKYRGFLPALFKELIRALQLTPSPVSKYRTFLRATRLLERKGSSGPGVRNDAVSVRCAAERLGNNQELKTEN